MREDQHNKDSRITPVLEVGRYMGDFGDSLKKKKNTPPTVIPRT